MKYKTKNDKHVKIIQKEELLNNIVSIEELTLEFSLFKGGMSSQVKRILIQRSPAVAVLLYDPLQDKVVLVEQFRVGAIKSSESPWLVEVVAGLIEENESPKDVAIRETKEESGLNVLHIEEIVSYWVTPGISTEKVTLFCAIVNSNNAEGIFGLEDESEDIMVQVLPRRELHSMLMSNKIKNAPTIISCQWLENNYARLRENYSY